MTTYKLYLDKKFKVNASLTEVSTATYLTTIECEHTEEIIDIINLMQLAADQTIVKLNEMAFPQKSQTN